MSMSDVAQFNKQMCYTARFIRNNSTLEPKCQLCGKKGYYRHVYGKPLMVQIFCSECRAKLPATGFIDGVPVIDVKDYLRKDSKIFDKYSKITEEELDKIDELLKSRVPKGQALNEVGFTPYRLGKVLYAYELERDKDIRAKLDLHFREVVKSNIVDYRVRGEMIKRGPRNNRLSEVQLEKNLSYRDIVKKSNERLTHSTLSNIANDKINPKPATYCLLAEILEVSVAEIYPNMDLYSEVRNFSDFKTLQSKYRSKLIKYKEYCKHTGSKNTLERIEQTLGFKRGRLYSFLSGYDLLHDDLKKLKEFLEKVCTFE